MMFAGIGMVGVGVIGLIAGAVVATEGAGRVQFYGEGGYLHDRRSDDGMKNGGIGLAIAAGVVCAAGIPVWIVGARKVPIKKPEGEPSPQAPEPVKPTALVRIGPAAATLEAQF